MFKREKVVTVAYRSSVGAITRAVDRMAGTVEMGVLFSWLGTPPLIPWWISVFSHSFRLNTVELVGVRTVPGQMVPMSMSLSP